jgi:hypothetical protein
MSLLRSCAAAAAAAAAAAFLLLLLTTPSSSSQPVVKVSTVEVEAKLKTRKVRCCCGAQRRLT